MLSFPAPRACRSPLPRQGEGEGEGRATATTERTQFRGPSPPAYAKLRRGRQSSPLLQGERRQQLRRLSDISQLVWSTCVAVLLVAAVHAVTAANVLPVYIEDNHAGTFYWLAQNIDLDQAYTLILIDARSDASGIFDSDEIRHALRNVSSKGARQTLLDQWRSKGDVQCFNWIEPLMPAPIAKVIWVPAGKLSALEIRQRTEEATALLDGHLEAAPRKCGSLRESYLVSDFQHLERHLAPSEPLIVTIDLDYFAGLPPAEQQSAFARIWNFVIERPNLRAITFAISRPYLQDQHETHQLLELALKSSLALPTARIQFEPFLTVANDHSRLAKRLIVQGKTPPQFEIGDVSQELRARILSERQRIIVRHDPERWQQLLRDWNDEAARLHLEIKNRQASTDEVWRVPAHEAAEVELRAEPWTTKVEKIEWFALTPKYMRCNVSNLSTDQVGFVANAAPRPAWQEVAIDHHDSVLPIAKIDDLFDRQLHCGSLRLRARAVVDGKIRETPIMELRRFVGSGFRASISEQFGLPYLFGSGELSDDSGTGPETKLGADCANFVVYALHSSGHRVPWSDPKRLRENLDLVALAVTPYAAKITTDDLQRGTIVHLGTHVAAVMEDREPLGVLDENDLVAHQLSGAPQMLTLGQLLRERKKDHFDLFRVPPPKTATTLMFGGDVMLGRSCADKIENGVDPFEEIGPLLRSSSFAAANLECTISNLGASTHPARSSFAQRCGRGRYAFRAPQQSAQLLRRAGFRAMGLANNHALDFGPPHCATAQRVYSGKVSRRQGLREQNTVRMLRAFSLCQTVKNSLCSRSAMLTVRPGLKSPRHPTERKLGLRLGMPGRRQILSFASFTGESKTAKQSLTNNAN